MAFGVKAFRRIQISNPEDTPGSAEAAIEVLCGVLSAPYGDKTMHFPEQDRNLLSRNLADDFVVQREVEMSFEGEVNTRQIIWALANAIRGNVTATQPAATAQPLAYLHTFQPGLATGNTPDIANGIDTFTIEFGDNVQAYEAEFVFCRSLEITGAPNEPVTMTWEMTGRQITETTFTAALTAAATQYFPSGLVKFYIDADYASIGGTQLTGMLRGFTWKLETNFTARYASDGTLVFSGVSEDRKMVELELVYYRDGTNSEAEKAKYDARTTSYARIEINGATEIDNGQSNPPYIRLDQAMRYTEWPEPDDEDGAVTETVTAQSVYDSVAAMEYEVTVLTELDDYPS